MTEDSERRSEASTLLVVAVLFEGGLAPLAVLLGTLFDRPALGRFSWSADDVALGVLATGPMLALFLFGRRWPVGPFRSIERFFEEEARPILDGCRWPDLALIALAAGVGEEMLFRGVFQGVLVRWLGQGLGWGAASLLFGLLHPMSPGYIVLATVLGAYLGGVWIWNGNLLTVIVAHAVYDFVALVLLMHESPDPA